MVGGSRRLVGSEKTTSPVSRSGGTCLWGRRPGRPHLGQKIAGDAARRGVRRQQPIGGQDEVLRGHWRGLLRVWREVADGRRAGMRAATGPTLAHTCTDISRVVTRGRERWRRWPTVAPAAAALSCRDRVAREVGPGSVSADRLALSIPMMDRSSGTRMPRVMADFMKLTARMSLQPMTAVVGRLSQVPTARTPPTVGGQGLARWARRPRSWQARTSPFQRAPFAHDPGGPLLRGVLTRVDEQDGTAVGADRLLQPDHELVEVGAADVGDHQGDDAGVIRRVREAVRGGALLDD